jgi:uncharacterized protein YcfJ
MTMNVSFKSLLKKATLTAAFSAATVASAQIIVFEHENFVGRNFTAQENLPDLRAIGFNDTASSVVVLGSKVWEICEDVNFAGKCTVLRPGNYPSFIAMGINDRASSLRTVVVTPVKIEPERYAPPALPAYDTRPRRGENRLYEADVVAVRAVFGDPKQRCWIEPEQVVQTFAPDPSMLAGTVLGGVIGHQFGGGRGKELATIGGAMAGAAVGANVAAVNGRPGQVVVTRNVKKCVNEPNATPAYWDVTYEFRGRQHHVQMLNQPGRHLTVNRMGEPRAGEPERGERR